MASWSNLRDDLEDSAEAQLKAMRAEVRQLRRQLSQRGGEVYDGGSDLVSSLYEYLLGNKGDIRGDLQRQAKLVQATARDNPALTAAVGIAVVGLLAGLLLRR